jgi:hypothetical protein
MPDTHLEERIAALEGSYREITKRIDDLRSETHRSFDGVRAEMVRTNDRLDKMGDRMETMFRWTMSMILVNWLSLLAGIFLVALRR